MFMHCLLPTVLMSNTGSFLDLKIIHGKAFFSARAVPFKLSGIRSIEVKKKKNLRIKRSLGNSFERATFFPFIYMVMQIRLPGFAPFYNSLGLEFYACDSVDFFPGERRIQMSSLCSSRCY